MRSPSGGLSRSELGSIDARAARPDRASCTAEAGTSSSAVTEGDLSERCAGDVPLESGDTASKRPDNVTARTMELSDNPVSIAFRNVVLGSEPSGDSTAMACSASVLLK